jgi:transcriptional regulator with GAF, ATPase, and Fis domain
MPNSPRPVPSPLDLTSRNEPRASSETEPPHKRSVSGTVRKPLGEEAPASARRTTPPASGRASRLERLDREEARFAASSAPRFGKLIGGSPAMRALFADIERVAAAEAAVLLHGETGTGKELVAEAIHAASPRRDGPFVTIDCSALPESLLEAELFGHARGAFTGAAQARLGAFEAAAGGTVLLDEIGELPLAMQPKLLRVLEAKQVRRLGETHGRPVDVRVIGASHRDLHQMVAQGQFREDLFFRLEVLPVRVPPLRERREDIPRLIEHFLEGEAEIPASAVRALTARAWRGNVRELRNVVARIRVLGLESVALEVGHGAAPASLAGGADDSGVRPALDEALFETDYHTFRERWIERGEAEYVRRLLERSGANVTLAARTAGLARGYLHRLIRKHGM